MVSRWREARPDMVGTEQDLVKTVRQGMQKFLGGEDLVTGGGCHLLLYSGEVNRDCEEIRAFHVRPYPKIIRRSVTACNRSDLQGEAFEVRQVPLFPT